MRSLCGPPGYGMREYQCRKRPVGADDREVSAIRPNLCISSITDRGVSPRVRPADDRVVETGVGHSSRCNQG